MFEKVNRHHPDKCADRIAGAITDLAYKMEKNPKIATEVLCGHGQCYVMIETSLNKRQLREDDIAEIIQRILGDVSGHVHIIPQDKHLADNQRGCIRTGDNGIFKGVPMTNEQRLLGRLARIFDDAIGSDGKYILDLRKKNIIVCQSRKPEKDIWKLLHAWNLTNNLELSAVVNPLGDWTGGIDVDCGCTNRKLGSDMGDAVTGGGLCGKDCSKADVSVNIACHLRAQESGQVVTASCAIGDEYITFCYPDRTERVPYEDVVKEALGYVNKLGGFEKFAEYGLI